MLVRSSSGCWLRIAEYRLTPAAERDLETIWTHTSQKWGVAQANRYIDILAMAFDELAQSPNIAMACNHIRSSYRRLGVERHMIYFRVTVYGILVVRIPYDRMDAPRYL